VKRKSLLLVAAAVVVIGTVFFCTAYAFRPFETIDYASFEPRFATTIRSAGFQTLEERSCSGEQVPLPLNIRLRQHHSDSNSGIHVATGFPNSAVHYKLTAGGSAPFDCFVRYLDSRATVIAVHARPAQASEARTLRATLVREFPGLTITLSTNDA
jgi:hypothetical protein